MAFFREMLAKLAAFFAMWTADHASGYTYDGDGYGRLQEYGSASRRPSKTREDSVPRGKETKGTFVRRAAPSFRGCEAGESLVWTECGFAGVNPAQRY